VGRRAFLGGLAGTLLAKPLAAEPQKSRKRIRIGYLSPSALNALESLWLLEFLRALSTRGYPVDAEVALIQRYADDRHERLPALAAELVDLGVDVILTFATPASLAAKTATATIPIVMVAVGDPIGVGLVSHLNRPDANLTGLALNNVESAGKRVELLKQAVPLLSQAAVLANPHNAAFTAIQVARTRAVAERMGVALFVVAVPSPERLADTFAVIDRRGGHGVIVLPDATFIAHRERIAHLALQHRLPSVAPATQFVGAGCLLAYGPDVAEVYRQAARFVERILRGARPSDLPVEQPTKYELGINLKTARTLRLTIPRSLLLRADHVIEYSNEFGRVS
jgi:putative ABC transport system substrate-binding protein